MNEYVHILENGSMLDLMKSPYVWIKQLVNDRLASKMSPNTKKPKKSLKNLLTTIENVYSANTPAALLTLGAQVLCLHYEALNQIGNLNVPVTVLFGPVNVGKSKVTKAALSLLGVDHCNFITYASNSKTRKITMETTLGITYDDPKEPNEIAEKILHHFDFGKSCNTASTTQARCTFITSLNEDCLMKLSKSHPKYTNKRVYCI